MTDRATFGDFALAARRHLDAAVQRSSTDGWTRAGVLASDFHEFTHGLHRVLKVMGRYLADVCESAEPSSREPNPWSRAAIEARSAVQSAFLSLPLAELSTAPKAQTQPQMTASSTRDLHAAATAMTAGRDLLHTHFASIPEGGREFRSEWASVITSDATRKALLAELVAWAQPIVVRGTDLTNTPGMRTKVTAAEERSVIAVCRWLTAMIATIEQAQAQAPIAADEVNQLYAIPASVLQPRRRPEDAQTVKELCQGITDCAERVRRAATTDLPDPALASWTTAESFHQAAAHATVISQNCEILQVALATQAAEQGATTLSRQLLDSAKASARARVTWLAAAQAWLSIKTDAYGDIAPASTETVDLALWTGRLAYADPNWTPTVGPDHSPRSPQELVSEPDDINRILAAVHQATTTLTTIAAVDYTQIRTAGLAGRLLVPVIHPGSSAQASQPFTRAPKHHLNALLNTYRDAGTASAKATAKIAEATDTKYKSRAAMPASRRDQPVASASSGGAGGSNQEMPGPVERILRELGVTDQGLLNRGLSLDEATSQLVTEAAQQSAPQRWNVAVRHLNMSHDTGQIIRHVLARHVALPMTVRSLPQQVVGEQLHPESDARQAEP